MSKATDSPLLLAFLVNVEKGLISGVENSSGPVILQKMTKAAGEILAGADTDKALNITRWKGPPVEPYTIPLAHFIHARRNNKEKWSVIELTANMFLRDNEFSELSLSRMKNIYKDYRSEVEAQLELMDSIEKMRKLTEEFGN